MHILDLVYARIQEICILLQVRLRPPIATQSAPDNVGSASLVRSSPASAAVGNASAKPPPAPVALRTPSSSSSASASPNSRDAAFDRPIRSFRLAFAIWMQAR